MKFLFARNLVSVPGTEFYYNGGLSLAMSYLIEKYTDMRVDRFAEKYLFQALKIEEYRWEMLANGLIDTDGGLHLKPIDQAKLGYLFLQDGVWGNKQLVSKDWVNEITKVQHSNTNMPDYSYQWWCGDFYVKNEGYFTYFASGHGGQKVLVLPEFDLVVVITQQVFSNPFGDFNYIAILSNYILPALTGDSTSGKVISMIQKDLLKLEGHYITDNNSEYMDILAEEGKLLLSSSDGQQNELYPISVNIFETRILDILNVQFEFVPDPDGRKVTINTSFGYQKLQFFRESY
jgi:CubicO group peptidase (beta-lactamase class C family)